VTGPNYGEPFDMEAPAVPARELQSEWQSPESVQPGDHHQLLIAEASQVTLTVYDVQGQVWRSW